MIKHSVRMFLDKQIRAVWDAEQAKWWYSCIDVVSVLSGSTNPRIYWGAIKRRHPELNTYCRQLKLYAEDGKRYLSDVFDERGIKKLGLILPSKNNTEFQQWLEGHLDPLDEQSKKKAHSLFESEILDPSNVGKPILLQQIHAYLFEGLYPFAGQIRTKTISKGGFVFANGDFLPQVLADIDKMPDSSLEEIVNKYVEMNIAHPFMEGNGRSTRIWLDMLLKERLKKCVDWSKIEKDDYLNAMKKSPVDPKPIFDLISNALTDEIDSREIFMKGIDYSYYYEEEE